MQLDTLTNDSGELIMQLDGELDALTATAIRPQIEAVVCDCSQAVVMDMSDVTFIDSSGVGLIVYVFKRLRAAGRAFSLIGVHGQVRELLELLRVDKALPVSFLAAAGVGVN